MTDREIEASGVHGRFDGLRSGTARLASLPFTFALAPRRALRNLSHKKQVLLSSPKHQHRFTFKDRVASPELDRKAEVQELVCELTMDEDWISLAELVEEWDQNRSNCPSKYRLIHYALDAIRETLTTNNQRTPQPDQTSNIPDAILQDLETAALAVPDQYALKAICTQLRIDQGWKSCEGKSAATIGDADREPMHQAFAKASALVSDLDASLLNSPLVALVKFRSVVCHSDAEIRILPLYEELVRLDPFDLVPHSELGMYMLPHMFGTYETLEIEARKSAASTHEHIGQAAYSAAYFLALRDDPLSIVHLDTELFGEGIDDLVRLRGNDPVFVANLVQSLQRIADNIPTARINPEMKAELRSKSKLTSRLANRILRDHLTGIHADSWKGGTKSAVEMISRACQRELKNGAHFKLDLNGLVAHYPIS